MDKKNNEFVAIKGRHTIINKNGETVENYIFENIEDVKDLKSMYEVAYEKLYTLKKDGGRVVHIYATGLTVAIITIINVVIDLSLELRIYHYDKDSDSYYMQALTEYLGKGV